MSLFYAVLMNGVFYNLFLSVNVFKNINNVNKDNAVCRWFIITLSLSVFCYPTFVLSDLIATPLECRIIEVLLYM